MPTIEVVRQRIRFGATMTICSVVAAAAISSMTSCNIVAPIAIAVAPPPSKDAEFEMPDRPTAVFVEDRQASLGGRPLRGYIGDKVCENLQRATVLEENVPIRTRDTLAVASAAATNTQLSVEEIGREVGAEQLIYIEMIRFNTVTEGDRPLARADLRVRVIDIVNRTQLFPGSDPEQYRSMSVDLPADLMFQRQASRAAAREAELALCDKIADDIAKLFYKHDIRPLGASINPEEHLR